jgi:hypothetical protein
MATIADALRYLISQAPGLSDTNRAELADAVDAEYGPAPVPPEAPGPAGQAGFTPDQAAEVAALRARLAELDAS